MGVELDRVERPPRRAPKLQSTVRPVTFPDGPEQLGDDSWGQQGSGGGRMACTGPFKGPRLRTWPTGRAGPKEGLVEG